MYNTKRWHEVQKHSTIQRNMVHHKALHRIQNQSTKYSNTAHHNNKNHTEQIHHKIRPKRDGIQTYLIP